MIEQSHGKARPTLPRSSDLASADTDAAPSRERDQRGRFQPGNSLASGSRWKHLLAESLGRDLAGEAGALGREAYRLYRAFLRDVPADTATVRQLLADRARWAVLSARYARRAAEAGFDTAEGADALKTAQSASQRAERLAVTAWDLATRAAAANKAKPIDVHGEVARVFGFKTTKENV